MRRRTYGEPDGSRRGLIESRIISRHSKQREDCFPEGRDQTRFTVHAAECLAGPLVSARRSPFGQTFRQTRTASSKPRCIPPDSTPAHRVASTRFAMWPSESSMNSCTRRLRCAGSRSQDDQQRAIDMTYQRLEKVDHLLFADRTGIEPEVEVTQRQPRRDGKLLPVEVKLQHRCLATWRPGAAAMRPSDSIPLSSMKTSVRPSFLGCFF